MKTCTKCKIEKPISEFGIRKNRSYTHNSTCKNCRSKYQNKWYQDNKAVHKARAKKCDIASLDRNKKYIDAIKGKLGCCDCGIKNPIVLDFDHIIGNKEFSIANAVAKKYSIEKIAEEIKKCVVRCANCHRVITHARRKSKKLIEVTRESK